MDEGDWTRELVRMNAAYAGDTLLRTSTCPSWAEALAGGGVLPGRRARFTRPNRELQRTLDFVVKSGRAVLYPVYKGTYQRRDSLKNDTQDSTNFWRDHVVMWAKDMSRSIDYAETRSDLDVSHLAYYGVSWGGAMGG